MMLRRHRDKRLKTSVKEEQKLVKTEKEEKVEEAKPIAKKPRTKKQEKE